MTVYSESRVLGSMCHRQGPTAELQRADTVARGGWRVRIETQLRVSCDRDSFKLQARLRAWHGDAQICDRTWNPSMPRDLM